MKKFVRLPRNDTIGPGQLVCIAERHPANMYAELMAEPLQNDPEIFLDGSDGFIVPADGSSQTANGLSEIYGVKVEAYAIFEVDELAEPVGFLNQSVSLDNESNVTVSNWTYSSYAEMKKSITADNGWTSTKSKAPKGDTSTAETRVSMTGLTFPKSKESDWCYYRGKGWLHDAEYEWFSNNHVQSESSGDWLSLSDSVRTIHGFISKKEFNKGWFMCYHSNRACKNEDGIEAMAEDGSTQKISSYYATQTGDYFLDEETKKYIHRNFGVEVFYKTDGVFHAKKVLKSSLRVGTKHQLCVMCSNIHMAELVQVREEFENSLLCEKCYDKKIRVDAIAPYNDKHYPSPIYQKKINRLTPDNKKMIEEYMKKAGLGPEGMHRLYGIEAEVEIHKFSAGKAGMDRWKLANAVKKTLGADFVRMKEDGTLVMNGKYSDNGSTNKWAGFEIVTAPADIATHRTRWPLIESADWHKHLRAWDTETCGLHIHVSRASLTPMIIGRMLVFVNHPKNKKFIQTMAGRSEEKFTKYHDKKISDAMHPERVVNAESDTEYNQKRRVAVNLSNAATVEFRIFRGTIRACHIIRDLEFVDAVIRFCYPCERPWRQMESYQAFIDFVAMNSKEWPELARWLYLHELPSKHLLPRVKPFGKKDTRGTKPPEVVEHVVGKVLEAPKVTPSIVGYSESVTNSILDSMAVKPKKKKPLPPAIPPETEEEHQDSDSF